MASNDSAVARVFSQVAGDGIHEVLELGKLYRREDGQLVQPSLVDDLVIRRTTAMIADTVDDQRILVSLGPLALRQAEIQEVFVKGVTVMMRAINEHAAAIGSFPPKDGGFMR